MTYNSTLTSSAPTDTKTSSGIKIEMIRIIAIATALITGFSAAYLYNIYQNLSSRIQHRSHCGSASALCPKPVRIATIPQTVYSGKYFAHYDMSSKSVSRSVLPHGERLDLLFTKLVRRNMTTSMLLPQALMFRSSSSTAEERKSFDSSQIAALDFKEGDLVCGIYRVKKRSKNTVEFEMQMKNMEFLDGRLAISFWEKGNKIVFCSETMMWRLCQEPRPMPLEKPLLRWMHETSTWWLLDSGVNCLMDLDS